MGVAKTQRDNLSTFGRIQKMLSIRWAFFYYLFENVDINPVRAVISNLSIAKIYRAERSETYRLLDEDFIIIRHPLYFLKNS